MMFRVEKLGIYFSTVKGYDTRSFLMRVAHTRTYGSSKNVLVVATTVTIASVFTNLTL